MPASLRSAPRLDRDLVVDLGLAGLAVLLLAADLALLIAKSPAGDAAGAVPPGAPAAIGSLSRCTNDVRQRRDGELVWREARERGRVYDGDAIYVAEGSEAAVTLNDGSRLEVDASSLVVVRPVASHEADEAFAVELRRGSLTGLTGSGELAIQVGGANAALRGHTQARLQVGSDQRARVAVLAGQAQLVGGAGASTAVTAGQRRDVDNQGVASATAEVLAVELLSPAAGVRLLAAGARQVGFEWRLPGPTSDEDQKAGCHLELSTEPLFRFPEDHLVRGAATSLSLSPAIYFWRVRCQREHRDWLSEERKLVITAARAPAVMRPRVGEVVVLAAWTPVAFAWTELSEAVAYELSLTAEGRPAITLQSDKPSIAWPADLALNEGAYCLRVRGRTADDQTTPWSEAACFRLAAQPVLRAPRLLEPKPEAPPAPKPKQHGSLWWLLVGGVAYAEGAQPPAVILRWEKLAGAAGYVIELAESPGFEQLLVRERVSEAFYRFRPPQRVDYFWRVRAFDESGREGQMSETRRLLLAPHVPGLLSPGAGAAFEYGDEPPVIELRWAGAGLSHFVVQVSRDPAALEASGSEVEGEHLAWRCKGVGAYSWRVLGREPDGSLTASETRGFVVKPAPPVPLAQEEVPEVAAEAVAPLRLAWSPRPAGAYEVQVAGEGGFEAPLVRLDVKVPSASVELPPGQYAWRVRATTPSSRWSATARSVVLLAAPPAAPGDAAAVSSGAEPGPPLVAAPAGGEGGGQRALPGAIDPAQPRASLPELSTGGLLSLFHDWQGESAVRLGLEVEWLTPWLSERLALLARLTYFSTSVETPLAGGPGLSRQRVHALPAEALACYLLPLAATVIEIGGGALVAPAYRRRSAPGAPASSRLTLEYGLSARLAVKQALGLGYLAAELMASASTGADGGAPAGRGGWLVGFGYGVPWP
jgi:hypothetical protein